MHLHDKCKFTQGGIKRTIATEKGILYTLTLRAFAGYNLFYPGDIRRGLEQFTVNVSGSEAQFYVSAGPPWETAWQEFVHT